MNRMVRQTPLLILFLCAGIAVLLTQGSLLQNAPGHDPSGTLARGLEGHPVQLPALEKLQVECTNARPTFQGSVVASSIGATPNPSEQAELVVFDKSYRPQSGLLRVHFGRSPPNSFSR